MAETASDLPEGPEPIPLEPLDEAEAARRAPVPDTRAAGVAAKDAATKVGILVIANPQGELITVRLDQDELTFGRDAGNSVLVKDAKCSRRHFAIRRTGGFYEAVDLGSTNGLRVNGKRLPRRRLREGDVIAVGGHRFTYHGPTDHTLPDELKPVAPATAIEAPAAPRASADEVRQELEQDEEPVPPLDETKCTKCQADMPPDAACPQCGTKSLRLQAQEFYVDEIVRGRSVLSGIGLWSLKRKSVLERAFKRADVAWVLSGRCPKCKEIYREINQFRPRCVPCAKCSAEIALPVHDLPEV